MGTADILNALMAIPNLIAVLLLSNVVVKETKKYINDLDAWSDEEVPVIEDSHFAFYKRRGREK